MGDEKDDIQDDDIDNKDGDGTNDNAGQGDDDDNGGDAGQDDSKKQDDDKSKKDGEDDDTPPPTRKTASDYYKERQEKKAGKANSQNKNDDEGENGDDDDDDIDPEDETLISKVVKKQFAPVLEKITAQEEKAEADEFFKENAEFKPYEAKILKWWKDPSRRHLPIGTVALEAVGYKNLLKIGAQKEQAATKKAKSSSAGGGNSGQDQTNKSVWEKSKEEFAADQERVLRNRQ